MRHHVNVERSAIELTTRCVLVTGCSIDVWLLTVCAVADAAVPEPSVAWVAAMHAAASIDTVAIKVSDVLGLGSDGDEPPPTALEDYRPHLEVLWDAFGCDRLIYGSNWPVCDRVGEPARVYGEQLAVLR